MYSIAIFTVKMFVKSRNPFDDEHWIEYTLDLQYKGFYEVVIVGARQQQKKSP